MSERFDRNLDSDSAMELPGSSTAAADSWQPLRRFTAARIALGHAGVSLPTAHHLNFQLAHARARDAVHAPLDAERLKADLRGLKLHIVELHSAATDRHVYLQRPDLGRRLDEASRGMLAQARSGQASICCDVAFVVADGLSALAIERHAVPVLGKVLPKLTERGRKVAPVLVVRQGRVAIGDEIGELIGARIVVVLIGERPGLSSPDSLGIYLTWAPRVGRTDSERNCISNVRPEGLDYEAAASRLEWLLDQATIRELTGVALKDETDTAGAALESTSSFLLPARQEQSARPIDPSILEFWGKARPDGNAVATWHPAALHSLDVAAVAAALLKAHPERAAASAQACGWPVNDWIRVVIFLVALHDVGKFSRAFQAMVEEAWPEAVLGRYRPAPKIPHDHVGFQMLASGPLPGAFASVFPGWEPSWRRLLMGAIAGHHGRPVSDSGSERPALNIACDACLQAVSWFIDEVKTLLDPPSLAEPIESEEEVFEAALASASWWLAGLTVVCDWLGSSQRWFPYWGDRQPASLQAYWDEHALPRAGQAVAANGLLSALVSETVGIRALQPTIETPSPVQQLIETVDLPAGPTCLLIEDVTGSGKTEAALVAAHRLMVAGRADGVFVALPTMATADAMFARVAQAYRRLFALGNPSLALAHGNASLNEIFTRSILRDAARQEPAGQDAADQSASAQCAAWLADDRRLAFLADIGVGTIDQALLAVLSVRHAPLRLHGLARKVLVIDEAHAYDAYMSEELGRLLQFHAALGGSSIVLSATLPQAQRAKLLNAFREGLRAPSVELKKSDYPLVTLSGAATCEEIEGSVRLELVRTVSVNRLDDVESCVAALIQASEKGACCAWVRNTVDDVLAGAEALRQAGVEPIVFHARFAMGDRLDIQDRVLEWFGKDSMPDVRAPGRVGRIVVSSQVIEQSLDLDFDFMVSDLAPVDLLIQRAGRLWRHNKRLDRSLSEPQLAVLSPEPSDEAGRDWAKPLGGTRHIYSADVLWRSARALFAAGAIDSPGNVRNLVEMVYGDNAEPVPEALSWAEDESRGKNSAARGAARAVLLDLEEGYQAQQGMWDPDVKVSTRLGDAQTQLRLAVEEGGSILPVCRHDDSTKAWSLSEISVRRNKATGAQVPPGRVAAIEAAKARWSVWERELPVLLLQPEGDGWAGELEKDGRNVPIRYDRRSGLRFF